MDALKKIYKMVSKVPFYKKEHDDIFVTGRLRHAFTQKKPSRIGSSEKNQLLIVHQEHILNEHFKCSYIQNQTSNTKQAFYKLAKKDELVNDAWCLWKNAVSKDKELDLKFNKKYLISMATV